MGAFKEQLFGAPSCDLIQSKSYCCSSIIGFSTRGSKLYRKPLKSLIIMQILTVKPQLQIHDSGHGRAMIHPDLSNCGASI